MGATLPVINEIHSVTFFEALDILGKSHNQFDLDPTDEVKLCEYAKKNYDSEFIFVEKFPGLNVRSMQWIRQTTLNLPKVLTCFSEVLKSQQASENSRL